MPNVVYPAVPTEVRDIDKDYIMDYLADNYKQGKISKDEMVGWQNLIKSLMEAKGGRGYFMPMRAEFVKAYFPSLAKKKQRKGNIVDFIEDLVK